jgi:pyridoxamine 5'-phosphate oxidase
MSEGIDKIRKDYNKGALSEEELSADPFQQFKNWFEEACRQENYEPNACSLATSGIGGQPSVRMVLLKRYDERGFVFFSHYESRKGQDLDACARAAMLFYWPALERQVRIEGAVEKTSSEESDEYFLTRPIVAQRGACVSQQSRVLSSRAELEEAVRAFQSSNGNDALSRPAHWGGYRVIPERYEFWQGRESRLHDRFLYEQSKTSWIRSRLWP